MNYIATFYTHSGAVKYQRYLKRKNITVELLPVPRKISSNCGIGARFAVEEGIKCYVSEDIEKLFQITEDGYKLVFAND
ncbi:MAG: DUF3343 domain-containing protein [bacterium]|jgi:hypothetical protein